MDGPRLPRPDGMRLGLARECASHKDAKMGVSRVRSEWTPDEESRGGWRGFDSAVAKTSGPWTSGLESLDNI